MFVELASKAGEDLDEILLMGGPAEHEEDMSLVHKKAKCLRKTFPVLLKEMYAIILIQFKYDFA